MLRTRAHEVPGHPGSDGSVLAVGQQFWRHLHSAVGFAVVSLALVWAPSLPLLECGTGDQELEGGWMMGRRRKVLRKEGAGGISVGWLKVLSQAGVEPAIS